MADLEKAGIELQAKGAASYIKDVTSADKATKSLFETLKSGSSGLTSLGSTISQATAGLGNMSKAQTTATTAARNLAAATTALMSAEGAHNALGTDATGNALAKAKADMAAAQAADTLARSATSQGQATSQANSSIVQAAGAFASYIPAATNAGVATSTTAKNSENLKSAFSGIAGVTGGLVSGLASIAGSTAHAVITKLGEGAGLAVGKLVALGQAAGGAVISGLQTLTSTVTGAIGKVIELGIHLGETAAKMSIGIGKESIDLYKDFSNVISTAGATSGLTGQALDDFKEKATALGLKLGADLPVSASEAAGAILELSKAGFSADAALGSASGTALLATATNLKMDKSAALVSNTINQFGLSLGTTEEATASANRVVDLLAKTANASAVDVTDLGNTFAYVGPLAKTAGFSLEDVAKATGILGNAGIKGSSAGTGLKMVLSQLASPSDKAAKAFETLGYKVTDSTGKIRPLQDQLVDLRARFKDLSQADKIDLAKQIAGQDHFTKFLALIDASPDSFNQMSDAIDHASGSAKDLSDAFNKTLAGSTENMKGSIETLKIKIGQALSPAVIILNTQIANLANKLGPLADLMGKGVTNGINKATVAWRNFRAGITGTVLQVPALSRLAKDSLALGNAVKPLTDAVKHFFDVLEARRSIITTTAGGIKDVGDQASNAHPIIDKIGQVAGVLADVFTRVAFGALKVWDQFGPLIKTAFDLYKQFSPLSIAFETLQAFMNGGLPAAIDTLKGKFGDLTTLIGGILNTLGTELVKHGPEILATLGNIATSVINWIGQQLPVIVNQLALWGQAFIDWVAPKIPGMLASLGQLIVSGLAWLGEQVPKIIEQLARWGAEFVAWVQPQIPGMLASLAGLITSGLGWIGEQIPKIVEQLAKWGKEFIDWVAPQIGPMLQELGKFLGQITGWIIAHIPDIIGKLAEWGMAFIGWVATDVIPKLPGELADILKGILAFVGAALPQIVEGIGKWVAGILSKAAELIKDLPDTLHKAFDAGVLAVGQFILDASQKISDLPAALLKGIGDLGGLLIGAGKTLIQGFINGFTSIHIPFPHFDAGFHDQNFGPVTIPVPYVNVSWYAKGGIFNQPSVIGVGDAGSEAALPIRDLVPLMTAALDKSVLSQVVSAPAAPAQMYSQISNTQSSTKQYNLNVNTNTPMENVMAGFELMQVMWGQS